MWRKFIVCDTTKWGDLVQLEEGNFLGDHFAQLTAQDRVDLIAAVRRANTGIAPLDKWEVTGIIRQMLELQMIPSDPNFPDGDQQEAEPFAWRLYIRFYKLTGILLSPHGLSNAVVIHPDDDPV